MNDGVECREARDIIIIIKMNLQNYTQLKHVIFKLNSIKWARMHTLIVVVKRGPISAEHLYNRKHHITYKITVIQNNKYIIEQLEKLFHL